MKNPQYVANLFTHNIFNFLLMTLANIHNVPHLDHRLVPGSF